MSLGRVCARTKGASSRRSRSSAASSRLLVAEEAGNQALVPAGGRAVIVRRVTGCERKTQA